MGGGRLLSVFFVKDVVYLSFYTLSKCIEIIINSLSYPSLQILLSDDGENKNFHNGILNTLEEA
mgnify:CR=1 FL=1